EVHVEAVDEQRDRYHRERSYLAPADRTLVNEGGNVELRCGCTGHFCPLPKDFILLPGEWRRRRPRSTHLERRLRIIRHQDHRVALYPPRLKARQQVHADDVSRTESRRDDGIEPPRGDVAE